MCNTIQDSCIQFPSFSTYLNQCCRSGSICKHRLVLVDVIYTSTNKYPQTQTLCLSCFVVSCPLLLMYPEQLQALDCAVRFYTTSTTQSPQLLKDVTSVHVVVCSNQVSQHHKVLVHCTTSTVRYPDTKPNLSPVLMYP